MRDILHDRVALQTLYAALATETAVLHTAEWRLGIEATK